MGRRGGFGGGAFRVAGQRQGIELYAAASGIAAEGGLWPREVKRRRTGL